MTEIRELIFPEDRTRYDELVYRRGRGGDIYGDPLDRHRVSANLTTIWVELSGNNSYHEITCDNYHTGFYTKRPYNFLFVIVIGHQ